MIFNFTGFSTRITATLELNRAADISEDLFAGQPRVGYDHSAAAANLKSLKVETAVCYLFCVNEQYTESILFNPENDQAYRRIRQRGGEDPWVKTYDWTSQGVKRDKIKPACADEKDAPPIQWTRQSKSIYPYPDGIECLEISDSTVLFYIVSTLDYKKLSLPFELCVFGKTQFHRLSIDNEMPSSIQVDFKIDSSSGSERVETQLNPLVFTVSAEPVVPLGEKPENFALLGLEKDIRIYIDPVRKLPVKVSGVNTKLGKLVLDLSEARLQ